MNSGFDAAFLVGYHGMAGTADSTIVHSSWVGFFETFKAFNTKADLMELVKFI